MRMTLAALLLLGAPAAAATITVGGGGDFASIQPALDAASYGDTVLVRPGEYLVTESLDFNRRYDPGQHFQRLESQPDPGFKRPAEQAA